MRWWFLCILFLYMASSFASDKDRYEYLPQISIPALRKIISEYARDVLAYRVKSFTNLPFGDKRTDEPLPPATIKCTTCADCKQHMIVTPQDKPQPGFHLIYAIPPHDSGPEPTFPLSDHFIAETYQPLVRYKNYKNEQDEDSLSIIFPRLEYYSLQHGLYRGGKYDLLEAVVDDKDKKANAALKTALFDE